MDFLNGRRVLILEEQRKIALILADMIAECGGEVVGPAKDISEALDLIAQDRLDAAILDITIGGQTTEPVAEELLARGIPFAFASGNKTAASIARYAPARLITKPYSADNIQKVLQELMAASPQ